MTNPYDHSLNATCRRACDTILNEFKTEGHVKISLAQFRSQILPFLADPNHTDIRYWLAYVKHPTVELHVMEPDNVTVKYIVPPLVERLGATSPGQGQMPLHHQMLEMQKRVERSPRSAEMELSKTLDPHIRPPKGILNNRIRLNEILVAEGYAPLSIPGAPEGFTGIGSHPGNNPTHVEVDYVDDEYDDL